MTRGFHSVRDHQGCFGDANIPTHCAGIYNLSLSEDFISGLWIPSHAAGNVSMDPNMYMGNSTKGDLDGKMRSAAKDTVDHANVWSPGYLAFLIGCWLFGIDLQRSWTNWRLSGEHFNQTNILIKLMGRLLTTTANRHELRMDRMLNVTGSCGHAAAGFSQRLDTQPNYLHTKLQQEFLDQAVGLIVSPLHCSKSMLDPDGNNRWHFGLSAPADKRQKWLHPLDSLGIFPRLQVLSSRATRQRHHFWSGKPLIPETH